LVATISFVASPTARAVGGDCLGQQRPRGQVVGQGDAELDHAVLVADRVAAPVGGVGQLFAHFGAAVAVATAAALAPFGQLLADTILVDDDQRAGVDAERTLVVEDVDQLLLRAVAARQRAAQPCRPGPGSFRRRRQGAAVVAHSQRVGDRLPRPHQV
jgi:hypothetical protein